MVDEVPIFEHFVGVADLRYVGVRTATDLWFDNDSGPVDSPAFVGTDEREFDEITDFELCWVCWFRVFDMAIEIGGDVDEVAVLLEMVDVDAMVDLFEYAGDLVFLIRTVISVNVAAGYCVDVHVSELIH